MSKKTKKDIPEDLIGFKEILTDADLKRHQKPKRDIGNNYEIFTFLERESIRLSKIIELCEDKVFILKKYPQQQSIHNELNKEVETIKKEIIDELKLKDSPLTKNLDELLSSHFNS